MEADSNGNYKHYLQVNTSSKFLDAMKELRQNNIYIYIYIYIIEIKYL